MIGAAGHLAMCVCVCNASPLLRDGLSSGPDTKFLLLSSATLIEALYVAQLPQTM